MTDTLMNSDCPFPVYPGDLKANWIATAKDKGFDIVSRIIDRFHLALRCHRCGVVIKVRLYTLMSAQPKCSSCVESGWIRMARAAGLTYLDRCSDDRHYAIYKAPCGHELRRQFEIIERAAAGKTRLRCEVCHNEYERQEAEQEGWALLGPDPEGNPSYRHYQHVNCGHTQRIARANIQSGRVSCGACGEMWSAAPSQLYAMRFVLPNSRELVKLGYSNNPDSRLHHQLIKDPDMPCAILRTVPVATGQTAIRLEKALHRKLRQTHPDAVVAAEIYRAQIRVKSEIYDASITQLVLDELDAIAAQTSTTGS